ncbi:hypothetical protein CMK14_22805 [Candidatus Poribacteria bacterium]|nr:hypothetical protein [Candidatus Poribacteria bacterium]
MTKPLTFEGPKLSINYTTSAAGGIRVEIQTDCPEIIGDRLGHIVSWASGTEISKLSDQPIRLKFQLKDADLFSLRFIDAD